MTITHMTYETTDMSRPFVHVPDALADRVTRAAAADAHWRVWKCTGCGNVEAGIHVDMRKLACAHCVQRVRENKAIGLTPDELWCEALAEAAKAEQCGVCGQKVGAVPEGQGRGRSVICRSCLPERRDQNGGYRFRVQSWMWSAPNSRLTWSCNLSKMPPTRTRVTMRSPSWGCALSVAANPVA